LKPCDVTSQRIERFGHGQPGHEGTYESEGPLVESVTFPLWISVHEKAQL
jgi:hypothetical protein